MWILSCKVGLKSKKKAVGQSIHACHLLAFWKLTSEDEASRSKPTCFSMFDDPFMSCFQQQGLKKSIKKEMISKHYNPKYILTKQRHSIHKRTTNSLGITF